MPVRKWRSLFLGCFGAYGDGAFAAILSEAAPTIISKIAGFEVALAGIVGKTQFVLWKERSLDFVSPGLSSIFESLELRFNGCGYRACHIAHVQLRNGFARAFPRYCSR